MPEPGSAAGGRRTTRATLLGFGAILLWAALAALTMLAGPIPPFQTTAMTFAAGTLVGVVWARMRGEPLPKPGDVPPAAWALGIYGLFAFHACYFLALRHASALEASLIVYLWPLLIVLMSALLPAKFGGRRLTALPLAGALLGLAGAVLILAGGSPAAVGGRSNAFGYAMALAAALIWSSYSVASRLFAKVPSTALIGSCAATALLSLAVHLAIETTAWPATPSAWSALLALGLGPVGLAFYLWDDGMKHGDIRLLGVASYATPMLSALLLAGLGLGQAHVGLWIAAVLIAAGAGLAGWDQLVRGKAN